MNQIEISLRDRKKKNMNFYFDCAHQSLILAKKKNKNFFNLQIEPLEL